MSSSTGRFAGSVWSSYYVDLLTIDPITIKGLDEGDMTDEQEETFAETTRVVYKRGLETIDRRGYDHEMAFSAQDDDWEANWKARSGIPLAQFKQIWDKLPTFAKDPSLHPGDTENTDPLVSAADRAEFLNLRAKGLAIPAGTGASGSAEKGTLAGQKRTASGAFGSSADSEKLHGIVCELAKYFFNSFPGPDNVACNIGISWPLNILEGKHKDLQQLEKSHEVLRYRIGQMQDADSYVEYLGLPLPGGRLCHEFDYTTFSDDFYSNKARQKAVQKALAGVKLRDLFPTTPQRMQDTTLRRANTTCLLRSTMLLTNAISLLKY